MHHKEEKSGAVSARVDNWMQIFGDEIFEDGCEKLKQLRSQKHQQRRAHAGELVAADQGETLDTDQSHVITLYPLDFCR